MIHSRRIDPFFLRRCLVAKASARMRLSFAMRRSFERFPSKPLTRRMRRRFFLRRATPFLALGMVLLPFRDSAHVAEEPPQPLGVHGMARLLALVVALPLARFSRQEVPVAGHAAEDL